MEPATTCPASSLREVPVSLTRAEPAADLRRWHATVVVAVLLAAAECAGLGDTPSSPTSTQQPPTATGTGATVPAFDRGRFAAVIPLPGAGGIAVADGVVWVQAAGTVVRIDPATNAAVGEPLRVPANTEAIAVGRGAMWAAKIAPGHQHACPGTRRPAAHGCRLP